MAFPVKNCFLITVQNPTADSRTPAEAMRIHLSIPVCFIISILPVSFLPRLIQMV